MAEAFLNSLKGDEFEAESAGLEPGVLNPLVVRTMEEVDIDISANKTKSVTDMLEQGKAYDYVITVCDESSAARCPVFPGDSKRMHWSFDDPSKLEGPDEEKLQKIRIIRDQIRNKLESWIGDLHG
jgi:arsenate reductase